MPDTELTIEPGKHNLVITRVFDAPRDLVFKTVTDSSRGLPSPQTVLRKCWPKPNSRARESRTPLCAPQETT
jgi:hypothetical protein